MIQSGLEGAGGGGVSGGFFSFGIEVLGLRALAWEDYRTGGPAVPFARGRWYWVKLRARPTQPSPRGSAPQLELPRPREPATRGVPVCTLSVAGDREGSMAKQIAPVPRALDHGCPHA